MEYIHLTSEILQIITAEQAWHYEIVPKSANNGEVTFYIDESRNSSFVKEELEILLGKSIHFENIPAETIKHTISRYYRKADKKNKKQQIVNISNVKSEDFLQKLIYEANEIGSSDIHIEAYEDKCRVRLRIDGKLVERYVISKLEYPSLINKIKIKANLDIAEKRLPQDGRIIFDSLDAKFDIRVSVLPTLHGEKAVLRLLSKDATNIDINVLGFSESQINDYLEGIKKSNGIVLISGPTGSGKTTTLYATLKILNNEDTNIVTIEDPIEYTLEGINQVQLKENIGLGFASALRTFLRQDPDIIMLGEIRDNETAQMAIRAALTGHLVLSTIHTNSAWGTVSRLIDMGVPPFLLSNTLNVTVAQRLVRLLCPHCKEETNFSAVRMPKTFEAPYSISKVYMPKGCESCFYTGFKGRKAVYEVIPIDFSLGMKIRNNEMDVKNLLEEKKIKGLANQAYDLLAKGETTVEEIYSILLNQ